MASGENGPAVPADAFAPRNNPPRVLVLGGSPRRDGNSQLLCEALAAGASADGSVVELVHVADHVGEFLRDCRGCRRADGSCAIDDGFRSLLFDKVLPADALVYGSPIWWYGVSGILKTFLDRIFCYVAHSCPDSERVVAALQWKRVALVLSAEESNFSARLAIVQQIQEMSRYLHHSLVGIVTGIGNRRGDVRDDPAAPLAAAHDLGRRLFEIRATDYQLDTDRPGGIWANGGAFPGTWR